MPGKGINGRANMQKFQMNSKKYGGNPFKYTSLVSSVGRASKGGMWNSIQRRAITHPPTAPAAPTNLIVTDIAAGVVKIVWTAPTNIGSSPITDYEYDLDNGGWITVTPAGLEQTLTGLTVGVAYSFKVRAVSIIGDGAEATTTIIQLIPDAPTLLSQLVTSVTGTVTAPPTQPTNTTVKLEWTAPANAPITDYLFSTDDANYTSNGSVNTAMFVFFSALGIPVPAPSATQTFYIKAKNNVGISPSVSVTLAGFTPGPITNNANFLAAIDGYLGTPVQKEAVLKAYYNIEDWNVTQVTSMATAFENGRATTFGGTLDSSTFNQNIGGWDTSSVTNMSSMFYNATAFNQNINTNGNKWNTAAVEFMSGMFNGAAAFNKKISTWDVSSVTTMMQMFKGATAFNNEANDLNWDRNTGSVTDMSSMFEDATAFNASVLFWDTTSVTNMSSMFKGATAFNKEISAGSNTWTPPSQYNYWQTDNVTDMSSMFEGATTFNLENFPPGSYDLQINTAAVTDMSNMFNGATDFNRNLEHWDISSITTSANLKNCFNGSAVNQTFSDTTGGGTWFTTAQNLAAVADIPNFYTNGEDYEGLPATATQYPKLTA